jgi:hypothetical protein
MPNSGWRTMIAVLLVAQSPGHKLVLLPLTGVRLSRTHAESSWLLDGFIGMTCSRLVGATLWTVALPLFIAAKLGLLGWIVLQT